jgi:hypothetical protein
MFAPSSLSKSKITQPLFSIVVYCINKVLSIVFPLLSEHSHRHLWPRSLSPASSFTTMKRIVTFMLLLACIQSSWAGCPSALGIYNCNGPRNPCIATTCPSGQVCHVNNCGGCKANCEPPGMVHIMSLGGRPNSQEGLVEQITGKAAAAAATGAAPYLGGCVRQLKRYLACSGAVSIAWYVACCQQGYAVEPHSHSCLCPTCCCVP